MLQYTIEAALGSRRLDYSIVSTDDETMRSIAESVGCPAPFRRPAELAADHSSLTDVALHALEWLEKHDGMAVGNVVLLQATSPLRDSADIDAAIATYERSSRKSLMSVERVTQHPCECVRLENGKVVMAVEPPPGAYGRQSLPSYFYINGAIYIAETGFLRSHREFHDQDSGLHIMEPRHGIDIDDQYGLDVARGLLALTRDGKE